MKVKAKRPLTHEGRSHQAGDVFETTDAKAKQLIESGHVEPVGGVSEESPEDDPKKEGGASSSSGKSQE